MAKYSGLLFGQVEMDFLQRAGRRRVGRKRTHHVHPVQGVQVVEVDHVILDELHGFQQVADDAGVVGNGDAEGVLDGAHRCDGVHGRADAADALGEDPGVARVAALQHHLKASEGGARAPGVGDLAVLDLHFDAQVAFDAGDRVNGARSRVRG